MSEPTPPAAGTVDERLQWLATDPGGVGQLVVRFHWLGDRFVHRVEVLLDGTVAGPTTGAPTADPPVVRLAEQLAEPPHASAWPVNPPLQQLDMCTLADNRRGFVGVGMAGRSHWSLAVEVREQQLWFDVACRIQQTPERLQSSYWLAEPSSLGSATPTAGLAVPRWSGLTGRGAHGWSVELRPDPQWTELILDADQRRVHLCPQRIPTQLPATVRWRYGFVATA